MSEHSELLEHFRSLDDVQVANAAIYEQREADQLQRKAAKHQWKADAARKELKRRKRSKLVDT